MKKSRLLNFLPVVISSLTALVLFDLVLMPFNLVFNSAIISEFNFEDPSEKQLRTTSRDNFATWSQGDPELGYLPRMGDKFAYSSLGTRHSDYGLEKPQGVRRVLMLGDSIAAIGNLAKALQKLLNPEKCQI